MKKVFLALSILAFYATSNAQKVSTRVIDNKGTIKWVLDSTTAVITRADSTIIFVTPKQLRDSLAKVVYNAGNGLTKQGDSVILGGTLSSTTTIATSATNFLRITGLQAGSLTDSIMTVNPATGQLRFISASSFLNNLRATNGITKNGDTVLLGGALNRATTITTSATNTLSVAGLQSGVSTDSVLVSDPATGQMKRVSSSTLLNNLKTSNGITKVGDTIQLGGALTKATTIATTATNTLSVSGLSSGAATDSVLVTDPSTGQVKRVSSSTLLNNLKASNGVTKSGDTVQLGGALSNATTITTTATNTLSVSGLQSGNLATDSILVADGATGQLKRVSSAIQSGETSFTATAGQTSYAVSGMPANPSRVWVYRNGAKLVGGSNSSVTSDYTVTAGNVTLILNGYSIIAGDVIEVQWVK
jgi:hypothetical protein